MLSGQFALVIVCDGPEQLADGGLEADLKRRFAAGSLHVNAWDVSEIGASPSPGFVLTVYGPDRPGIVHAIASAVAALGVGICDMSCRFQGELYVLTMELDVPGSVTEDLLDAAVTAACGPLGLKHSLKSMETAEL